VQQDEAPESLVLATDGGELESLTLTVTDKTWFVEAVVAALVGLFLFFAGVVLLFSRRSRSSEHPASTDPAASDPAGRSAAGQPTPTHPRDPEEVTR
jgi:hypothetical protein